MKCKATLKRFWNGVMVGPGTGNDEVNYDGDPKDKPEDFIEITEEMREEEARLKQQKHDEAVARSRGLTMEEYSGAGAALPASGGGEEAKSADEVAREIRSGREAANAAANTDKDAADKQAEKATDDAPDPIKGGQSGRDAKRTGATVSGNGSGKATGSPVTRPETANESVDQTKVAKDEEGNAINPVAGEAGETPIES